MNVSLTIPTPSPERTGDIITIIDGAGRGGGSFTIQTPSSDNVFKGALYNASKKSSYSFPYNPIVGEFKMICDGVYWRYYEISVVFH